MLAGSAGACLLAMAPVNSRAVGPRSTGSGGLELGAAVQASWLGDAALRDLIRRDCTAIVPEWEMNWSHVQAQSDASRFDEGDTLARFAEEEGLSLNGHVMLWHRSVPNWADAAVAGGDWRPIRRYLAEMTSRYPGVAEWKVVNESIDTVEGRGGLRKSPFLRGFGPDYIVRAFSEMRELAPSARLLINEYSLEYANPVDAARRGILLRLVEDLAKRGVIDTVGIQAHLDLAKGPLPQETFARFLQDLADRGVSIAITELDVLEAHRSATLATRDAEVAAETKRLLEVAMAQPAVRSIATWGLSDRASWLIDQQTVRPVSARQLNRGLPYDAELRPKGMYRTLHTALAARRAGLIRPA
jgi:endo-1,4-beta-xylanase